MPLNPDIANTFYRAGFIESWGRGIEKICKLCLDYDIPAPEYTVHGADIMMLFRANVRNDDPNGPNNVRNNVRNNVTSEPNEKSNELVDNNSITDIDRKQDDDINVRNNVRNRGKNDPNDANNVPNTRNLTGRQCTLLRFFAVDEYITVNIIAKEMKVTEKTIRRDIAELKKLGLLSREGGTRGKWVVNIEKK